jgi:hypothetical protein
MIAELLLDLYITQRRMHSIRIFIKSAAVAFAFKKKELLFYNI